MTTDFNPFEILVRDDRQREDTDRKSIRELAEDIEDHVLYHAPVIYDGGNGPTLVAGGRRLAAIRLLLEEGKSFYYGDKQYTEDAPFHLLTGEWSDYDLEKIELHENIMRKQISWQEHTRAVARLHRMEKERNPQHTVRDTGRTVAGLPPDDEDPSQAGEQAAQTAIVLDKFLDDPDVAAAPNQRKALKIAESKERARRYEEKQKEREEGGGAEVKSPHTIIQRPFADWHNEEGFQLNGTFRCICTDPPYGLDIGNSHWGQGSRAYTDDAKNAAERYTELANCGYQLLEDEGFLFAFCDPRMFTWLTELFTVQGWDVWPHPLIWDRSPKGLLPVPSFGPRRCYEMILFARKGAATVVNEGRGDVLRFPLNPEHNRPGEKPVDLFTELLSRVVRAGDKVLDPFAGTGPILPAAHSLMAEATALDIDDYAIGACRERLENL